jgi:penicillin-binding protein 2
MARSRRAIIVMLAITSFMGVYVARLAQLQLIEGPQYREQANENRIRLVPLPAARGNILDRHGNILASNHLTRSVYLWPREQSPQEWKATAAKLAAILEVSQTEIVQKLDRAGYRSSMPVRIVRMLDLDTFVELAERSQEFPGLEVRGESSRFYPNGNLAAHILGYIGEATEKDLQNNPDYPLGVIVGKMGVERSSNEQLVGKWGQLLVEINAAGEELRELGKRPPSSGNAIRLTLDQQLQKQAESLLGKNKGAAVVLDVNTGAVLAMASSPSFDPNIFTGKVTSSQWQRLQAEGTFVNRALQGYPPGSTFKIVTATAGLESDQFFPGSVLYTPDYITVGGLRFYEHSSGYGYIGFRDALAFSSNTFFYQVGLAVGAPEIAKWGRKLGIGGSINLDLLGLDGGTEGFLPTPQSKQREYGEPWYAGDTVTTAIGQGLVLATPLELAVMVATIANGGARVQPHLLARQTNTPQTKPIPTGVAPSTISKVRQGLVAVVEEGTARSLNRDSLPLTAGKTGTAEVVGKKSHALYVAYGPAKNPEIAIAVVVENGGYGGVAAAPIAGQLFETYFTRKDGRKIESSASLEQG